MAHGAALLLVPVDVLSGTLTRESLVSGAIYTSHCSHLIAVHPEIRTILDEGIPVQSEMWHPIAKPHYRLPQDLPPIVVSLKLLVVSDEHLKADAWYAGEVRRLIEACELAIQHGLALVVLLSGTLSNLSLSRHQLQQLYLTPFDTLPRSGTLKR
jgi:hypothetical protein